MASDVQALELIETLLLQVLITIAWTSGGIQTFWGANTNVVVDMGGSILDWEDEYGVVESYPDESVTGASHVGGGVGSDVGLAMGYLFGKSLMIIMTQARTLTRAMRNCPRMVLSTTRRRRRSTRSD